MWFSFLLENGGKVVPIMQHNMHLSEVINCMEQSPRETSQVSYPYWNQIIHYVVHRGPPVVFVLSLTNQGDIVMPYTLDQSSYCSPIYEKVFQVIFSF